MTDRDALRAAIVAQPDEDVPRLAFADWLTENGEPERGEFIRVQCEAARLPVLRPKQSRFTTQDGRTTGEAMCSGSIRSFGMGKPTDLDKPIDIVSGRQLIPACLITDWAETPLANGHTETRLRFVVTGGASDVGLRAVELSKREHDLFEPSEETYRWIGPAKEVAAIDDMDDWWSLLNSFNRGFVESVHGVGRRWVEHGDAVLEAHPLLHTVTLTSMPPLDEAATGGGLFVRWNIRGRAGSMSDHFHMANLYRIGGPYRRGMVLELLKSEPAWKRVKTWNIPTG